MRSIPLRLWALSLFSALLQLLPFPIVGPAPIWCRLFSWFCLVPLLVALLGRTRSGVRLNLLQSALLSYLCGVVWYIGNCYWIYRTMYIYENIPILASMGILLLFALYVGLYHALFGYLIGLLNRFFSPNVVLLAVPFTWVAVELARASITGFPWDLLGYTQVENFAFNPLATLTGVMGLSFVVAAVNALWLIKAPGLSRYKYVGPLVASLVFVTAIVITIHPSRSPAEPAPAVATLLQENLGVGSDARSHPETKEQMLTSFAALSLHPTVAVLPSVTHPQIIAWPEAPTPFVESDPVFRSALSALAVQADAPVVANAVSLGSRNPDGHYNLYNSASFFAADGHYAGRYDKMHLVPFGEYTPYKPLFFFVGHLLDDLLFIPGTARHLLQADGHTYGVFICYESIFGDDMRQFANEGAQVLVNISDDGWYGDTSAPWQHLDMVRMRAIESRRWIVRATNTGITADIDPSGRVVALFPRHIRGSIQVPFGYRDDRTFYSRYGDWFAGLCSILLGIMLLIGIVPRVVQRSRRSSRTAQAVH